MFDIRHLFAAPPFRRPNLDEFDHAAALIERSPQEAIVALERALRHEAPQDRTAFAHNKRGVALMALGRRDDALLGFARALVAVENYAPALVNIGNMLLEDGDVADAIEHYRAAISADGSYAGAYLNLAIALKRVGRASEAARCLRKALRLETRRRF